MTCVEHRFRSPRARYAILVASACASPHPSAEGVSPTRAVLDPADSQTPVATRIDPPVDAGTDAGTDAPVAITDADACTNAPLPPAFVADGAGARPALPTLSFDECSPIDLDDKPPCEVACSVVAPAPDFRSDDGSANFHMLEHTVYFTGTSPAKQIGRIVTYDGPLDAANAQHAAESSTVAFVDHRTSPPILELRSGSCLFECNGHGTLTPTRRTPTGKSDADCRAACPPLKRYRYDGKRLQPVR
jgi:hypothetical protein